VVAHFTQPPSPEALLSHLQRKFPGGEYYSAMSVESTIKDDLFQEQVIKAAQLLFRQYGLEKVTMDEVAKAVGKGRSSLYYYYKNKIEIFGAVMDLEIDEILTEVARAVDKAVGAEQHRCLSGQLCTSFCQWRFG